MKQWALLLVGALLGAFLSRVFDGARADIVGQSLRNGCPSEAAVVQQTADASAWLKRFYSPKRVMQVKERLQEVSRLDPSWSTIPGNPNHAKYPMKNNFGIYYLFTEYNYCLASVAVGAQQLIGDGYKFVCNPHIIKTPCLMYSMGVNEDISYELDFLENVAACEIHAFDPAPHVAQNKDLQARLASKNIKFHGYGIGLDGRTLTSIQQELGHHNRVIDVLKMDIEGGEYDFLEWLVGACNVVQINQIQLEFHLNTLPPSKFLRIIQQLEECGFLHVRKEPNRICDSYEGSFCFEAVFAHKRFLGV